MKSNSVHRRVFLAALGLCLVQLASAQSKDSTFYLFRSFGNADEQVSSIDSAEYYRVIPPFELETDFVEIKEYYKNGKLRMAGKAKPENINLKFGTGRYEGACIKFYSDGKRKSIVNYTKGLKDGQEFRYYPDGKLCAVFKSTLEYERGYNLYSNTKLVDFYDREGTQICAKGEGFAIVYDSAYLPIVKGPVRSGKMDGDWAGIARQFDDVKFKLNYHANIYRSGEGFEISSGKLYKFESPYLNARPEVDLLDFVDRLRKKIKFSKNTTITKAMIDSTQIYFEVEPNGDCTNITTVNKVPVELMYALRAAMHQCAKWEPAKLYGIPLKTQVVISLILQPGIHFIERPGRTGLINRIVDNYQRAYYHDIEVVNLPTIPRRFE